MADNVPRGNGAATCVLEGCQSPVRARGWCKTHYDRWRYWGDPSRSRPPLLPTARYRKVSHGRSRHRIIAEETIGRRLPRSAQIHHVDGNGLNNERRNLVICQSDSYHKLLHARTRVLAAGGDPNREAMCCYCHRPVPFDHFARYINGPRAGKRSGACKPCMREYDRNRQLHREGARHV